MSNLKLGLIVLSTVVVFTSCSNDPSNKNGSFELKGTLSNSNHDTLLLEELSPQGMKVIDTAYVKDDGSFEFTNASPILGFYNVKASKNNFATIILDSAQKVTLTGNARDLGNTFKAEGSKETDLFVQMNKVSMNNYKKLDSLRRYFQQYLNTSHPDQKVIDSLDKAIQPQFDEIRKQQNDFIITTIKENTNSIVTLAAVQQLKPANEYADIYFMVDSALMLAHPNSPYVKFYHQQMQEFKKQLAIRVGGMATDIVLNTPQGTPLALFSLKGKVVLIDFWASWCGPCREENPNVVKAYNKFKNKGFEIYAVSLDKKQADWENAIAKDKLTWLHVSDLKGWQSSAARQYGVESIPANFLIDKEGKILATSLRGEDLEKALSEVLK